MFCTGRAGWCGGIAVRVSVAFVEFVFRWVHREMRIRVRVRSRWRSVICRHRRVRIDRSRCGCSVVIMYIV